MTISKCFCGDNVVEYKSLNGIKHFKCQNNNHFSFSSKDNYLLNYSIRVNDETYINFYSELNYSKVVCDWKDVDKVILPKDFSGLQAIINNPSSFIQNQIIMR